MLLEAKTGALCPSNNHGTRFAANGDTWMGSTRKAVVERDMAAKKLDDALANEDP
jgi:hypothetical protein